MLHVIDGSNRSLEDLSKLVQLADYDRPVQP